MKRENNAEEKKPLLEKRMASNNGFSSKQPVPPILQYPFSLSLWPKHNIGPFLPTDNNKEKVVVAPPKRNAK